MPQILETLLSGISERQAIFDKFNLDKLCIYKSFFYRWRNWIIRGIFGWLMIGLFCLLCYGGPLALMIAVCILKHFIFMLYNYQDNINQYSLYRAS